MRKQSLWALIAAGALLVNAGILLLTQSAPPTAANAVEATPAETGGEVPRVTVQDLHAQLQSENPPLVWELRTPESYAQAHVPGSRLLTLNDIEAAAQGLDRNQPIAMLCA